MRNCISSGERRGDCFKKQDTFGPNVNGGKMYFNWCPNYFGGSIPCKASGAFYGDVWVGDIDCLEAIRHQIGELENTGTFVTPWKFRPFLWLLHYNDRSEDYRELTEERIAMLPKHVQRAITPN